MKRSFGLIDRAVLGSLVLVQSAAVYAQDADTGADQGGLQEVVVTAEKRPSIEQKTAIAMSVLDSKALERNGVASVADLGGLAPSVSFATSNATSIITIRGISSRDTTEIGDPAISLNIDGFNLQRAIGLNATLFDLERVEVLRGPQGTLLGRNATGGAINLITAKPTNQFAASVAAETGNFGEFNSEGMINLPVNDWLKVRAAVQTRSHAGYRDNSPAFDGDDERSKAGRLHIGLDPNIPAGERREVPAVRFHLLAHRRMQCPFERRGRIKHDLVALEMSHTLPWQRIDPIDACVHLHRPNPRKAAHERHMTAQVAGQPLVEVLRLPRVVHQETAGTPPGPLRRRRTADLVGPGPHCLLENLRLRQAGRQRSRQRSQLPMRRAGRLERLQTLETQLKRQQWRRSVVDIAVACDDGSHHVRTQETANAPHQGRQFCVLGIGETGQGIRMNEGQEVGKHGGSDLRAEPALRIDSEYV